MPREIKSQRIPKQQRMVPGVLDQLVSAKQLAYEFDVREMKMRRWLRGYYAKRDRTFWLFTRKEAEEVRRYLRDRLNGRGS